MKSVMTEGEANPHYRLLHSPVDSGSLGRVAVESIHVWSKKTFASASAKQMIMTVSNFCIVFVSALLSGLEVKQSISK